MNKRKYTHELVYKIYKNYHFELLEEYTNCDNKHQTKCICGNIFYPVANKVLHGRVKSCGCLINRVKLDYDVVVQRYKACNLELLDTYTNAKTKVLTKCSCGKKFLSRPDCIFTKKIISCGCKRKRNNILEGKFLTINSIRVSKVQLKLHQIIGRGVINFKSGRYYLDIAFVQNNKKIAIEYDSWLFHKDKIAKDLIRLEDLKRKGWNILLIKANGELPSQEALLSAISDIISGKQNFIELKLNSWKN